MGVVRGREREAGGDVNGLLVQLGVVVEPDGQRDGGAQGLSDRPRIEQLVELGRPWLTPRTPSDDWFYATLFSATCPGRRQSREGVRLECLV